MCDVINVACVTHHLFNVILYSLGYISNGDRPLVMSTSVVYDTLFTTLVKYISKYAVFNQSQFQGIVAYLLSSPVDSKLELKVMKTLIYVYDFSGTYHSNLHYV